MKQICVAIRQFFLKPKGASVIVATVIGLSTAQGAYATDTIQTATPPREDQHSSHWQAAQGFLEAYQVWSLAEELVNNNRNETVRRELMPLLKDYPLEKLALDRLVSWFSTNELVALTRLASLTPNAITLEKLARWSSDLQVMLYSAGKSKGRYLQAYVRDVGLPKGQVSNEEVDRFLNNIGLDQMVDRHISIQKACLQTSKAIEIDRGHKALKKLNCYQLIASNAAKTGDLAITPKALRSFASQASEEYLSASDREALSEFFVEPDRWLTAEVFARFVGDMRNLSRQAYGQAQNKWARQRMKQKIQ